METDSKKRKQTPMFSGLKRYFPDALAAVARLSWKGNHKHNPGKPLHHCRSKSGDHGDCLERHQAEFDQMDAETEEYHAVEVAWRSLAQLQELLERHGAPRAPGAYSKECLECCPPPQQAYPDPGRSPFQIGVMLVDKDNDLGRRFVIRGTSFSGLTLELIENKRKTYQAVSPMFWEWKFIDAQLKIAG